MAGYFGGYASKAQDMGAKELRRLREALERKVDRTARQPMPKEFHEYSKRLLKDLEAKSMVRTAVETLNLSLAADHQDVLKAECVRTFPTVTFPAASLLRREEVETGKVRGKRLIAGMHHSRGATIRSWTDAPFDLLYGFRGNKHGVDLLSPYEMIRFWQWIRVVPPSSKSRNPTSEWTSEGLSYINDCKIKGVESTLLPGVHYIALESNSRILLPDVEVLDGLRHTWMWERRFRPVVPVWNFAKMPRPTLPAEENARLLSVYMRPWTLHAGDKTAENVLLTELAADLSASGLKLAADLSASGLKSSADAEPANKKCKTVNNSSKKYAAEWHKYLDGGVVSKQNRNQSEPLGVLHI